MALERRRSATPTYVPMRDVLERLFDGGSALPRGIVDQMQMPAANLRVTDDEVIIEVAAPGVDPEDITISVTGDTVTVSGEMVREQHDTKGQTYYEEIMEGRFQRSFVLPFPVDAQGATAAIDNGILKLTLPKSASAKPHKVQVQSGNGSSKKQVIEGSSASGETSGTSRQNMGQSSGSQTSGTSNQSSANATQGAGNGSKEASKSSQKSASAQKTHA